MKIAPRGRRLRQKSHSTPLIPATRRVVIDFPEPLFRATERAVAELSTSRSSLVRAAVEQYLEALRRKRLEEELAAGYAANSAMDRKIAAEFSAVDYETF
jgi:metal-responsive CopG/Arc/MetJ family transcriptional regulator